MIAVALSAQVAAGYGDLRLCAENDFWRISDPWCVKTFPFDSGLINGRCVAEKQKRGAVQVDVLQRTGREGARAARSLDWE